MTGVRERSEEPPSAQASTVDSAEQIARGRYLALAGNCAGCHTVRGGAAYAGGRAVETPFGNVYASNLTPDAQTGIGHWSADDFWRALHLGKSKNGKLLYPAAVIHAGNYLIVSEEGNHRIQVFTAAGGPVAVFGTMGKAEGQFKNPQGIEQIGRAHV